MMFMFTGRLEQVVVAVLTLAYFSSGLQITGWIEVSNGLVHASNVTINITAHLNISSVCNAAHPPFMTWEISRDGGMLTMCSHEIECSVLSGSGTQHENTQLGWRPRLKGFQTRLDFSAYLLNWHVVMQNVSSGNYTVLVLENSEAWISNTTNITVKDCDLQQKHVNISLQDYQPIYQSEASLQCVDDALLYKNYSYVAEQTPFLAQCGATARWENNAGYSCWYAADVFMMYRFGQPAINSSMTKQNVSAGSNMTFLCSIDDAGNPPTNILDLFWDKIVVFSNMTADTPYSLDINSSHHDGSFYCRGRSQFTRENSEKGHSNVLKLSVSYAPEQLKCEITAHAGGVNEITLSFKSNPAVTAVSLILNGDKGRNMTIRPASFTSTQQMYSQNITSLGLEDISFNITFDGGIISKKRVDCLAQDDPGTTITNLHQGYTSSITTPGTGAGNQSTTPLTDQMKMIIIICASTAGGILMIILIVLVCRKRRKGVKQQEVINPIYDTTNMSGAGAGGGTSSDVDSVKVERENPLYGTAAEATYAPVKKKKKTKKDSSAEVPEATGNETYASVVKPKKGKKKGSENGESNVAFTEEADATYAAVNKKKKRADKSEDKPSTSGLGNNVEVSQDCTYAAVQKKDKKKPKDDDEDLHGSSK